MHSPIPDQPRCPKCGLSRTGSPRCACPTQEDWERLVAESELAEQMGTERRERGLPPLRED